MLTAFQNLEMSIKHLKVLHNVFITRIGQSPEEKRDLDLFKHHLDLLDNTLRYLGFYNQLYQKDDRQMILADVYEYIFFGRGYYCIEPKSLKNRQDFVQAILRFVNLLMGYEAMTVTDDLRAEFLQKLKEEIPAIAEEPYFGDLTQFKGKVGLPAKKSDASEELNDYFDSLLPKTAGGLWHELLVFAFLLRNNVGFIIPLLLTQRLISKNSSVIPPDFLVVAADKNIYGIEVGRKKEIQSGSFSLQTRIPTASLDTENSRVSDRCPKCNRWIPFCEFVIKNYSNFDYKIEKVEIRCLENCDEYSKESIAAGECPYTKYRRKHKKTLAYTDHPFADGLHYHYQCVLSNLDADMKDKLVEAKDSIALKTHYPYYAGLESLMRGTPVEAEDE